MGYMSLLHPVPHSLVPRYAFHMAGNSMVLVGVLLQFFFSSPPYSIDTVEGVCNLVISVDLLSKLFPPQIQHKTLQSRKRNGIEHNEH